MKKIIISLSMVVAVATLVTGATIAFYNDTETSTGNIFVAGAIDLKVDHTFASYNGEDCVGDCREVGNSLIVNGGFETPVVTDNGGQWQVYPSGITGWDVHSGAGIELQRNGVAGAPHGGRQLVELDSHGSGSQSSMEQIVSTVPGQQYRLKFWHSPRPNNSPDTDNAIRLNVEVTSNSGTIINQTIGQPSSSGSGTVWTEYVYNFIALDTETTIRFTDVGSQADTLGGYLDDVSLFTLDCEDTFTHGGICVLWGERDLGSGDTFWNFSDIKPGDYGENMISLHVYSNDAFVCLLPHNINDEENGIVDPEEEAGDAPDQGNVSGFGELSDELEFFIWHDLNGNNQYDGGDNEPVLVPAGTPFNEIPIEIVALSLVGNSPISIVGMSWCAGEQSGPQSTGDTNSIICDGNGMGNIAQTDSVTSDFVAYAEQQRNNSSFLCSAVVL